MPNILFIEHDGREQLIEAVEGKSVMQTAVDNMVNGIAGDCGGSCSCATCHAYIEPAWMEKLTPADDDEMLMLEGAVGVRCNSRLTCQIKVRKELDGLIVWMPASQY